MVNTGVKLFIGSKANFPPLDLSVLPQLRFLTTPVCMTTYLVWTLASDFMWTLNVGESGSDRSCSGVITWPTNCAGAENLGRRGRFRPRDPPSSKGSLDSVGFT